MLKKPRVVENGEYQKNCSKNAFCSYYIFTRTELCIQSTPIKRPKEEAKKPAIVQD